MKKLALMAVVALMAGPAMAALEQEATVTITVGSYCEVTDPPDLSFNVAGPLGTGTYGDIKEFDVKTNADCTLTATVPAGTTSHATAAPGTPGVSFYPTAYGVAGQTPDIEGERIGFGIGLTNLKTSEYGPWDELEDGEAQVSFGATLTADLPNARITLNSYMDSARDGRALARPGNYTTTITLTVALGP